MTKGNTFKLEHLNPRHRAEAIAQGCAPTVLDTLPAPIAAAPAPKRMRQSEKPLMNELETRFFEKITRDYAGSQILVQAVRLELARGHWYKPDFFIPHGSRGPNGFTPLAYEVKGPHAFRGGFENLKVAARIHPWIQFWLVWEDESKIWQRQQVFA